MPATGSEQQIPTPQLQDPGDDRNLVSILRRRVAAREPFAADSFIQEADVYLAAPAELVRDHAPGMDLGEGKETAWYFFSPANYHETPGARRRKRKVGGADAGETCCWHPEAGKVPILGPGKKPVGAYKRKLSYVLKVKNPPGSAKPYRNKSLGWIMVEIGLEQQQADQQLVLCKLYKSRSRRDAEISISTGACRVDAYDEKPCPAPPPPAAAAPSCDSQVTERKTTTSGYNIHSPRVAQKPPLSIPLAFKHGTRSRPMGGSRSGVAIEKKASPAVAVTVVMKFGGSLTQSAHRMKEMAKLVRSFPDGGGESPVVVLSAMGNTTTNLLLAAGKALSCRPQEASEIHELAITKELHFRMVDDLGLHRSIASGSLEELENVFVAIAVMKELTSKTRDYLVSFGEHMSTRIFSAYLNKLGEGARQEWESFPVDTCGRGGSDLTMTTIGTDRRSREIQVWKDVDGVLTCDPNVCANAIPLPYLTFDEAAELGLFDGQSKQLAMEGGIPVIVKNLCNLQAPGTMITKTRDMSKSILTSIMLKSNVTMMEIENTSKLGQYAFAAKDEIP
ncbi:aspartokinase 1, chloroplastic-like [Triticum dicoccoides]|uniref:aspartokinase 1, chloroplastic-like n=1 Tax=Triticum dicoccoides TaxID=85692 RepID=UPI001891B4C5|nr:aspartokinase 1, chloroplastic-like [Triticum dicoccoides]